MPARTRRPGYPPAGGAPVPPTGGSMNRRRAAVVGAACAAAAAATIVVVPLAGSTSAAGTPAYTSWHLQSDDNYPVPPDGKSLTFTSANATFDVSGDDSRVVLTATGTQEWRAEFVAPPGERLVPGTTFRPASSSRGGVAPVVSVGSSPVCESVGEFTVQQADFHPITGAVQSFAVTFRQQCLDYPPGELRGSLAFQAPSPPAAVPATHDV